MHGERKAHLMPQNFQNYIAGAWHDGDMAIENINPSDLADSIGHYAQANRHQLDNELDAAELGGAFGGTGQKCTASSRSVAHNKIYDEFVDKLSDGARAMVVDHALKVGTQIGPVVSQTQLDENLAWVNRAKTEGGDILFGGTRVTRDTDGYYMTPAVVAGTKNSWKINREEMVAPIACVIKVDSYDEAVDVVNDTHFGLTSGIITRSLARATDFRRRAQTGVVTINLPTAGTDYHVPFGGRGSSSYGPREQGRYAEEFYTTVKTSYIAAGKPD